jgi:hypothetical protein
MWKRISLVVLLVVALAIGGFVWWAASAAGPGSEAVAALESSPDVNVLYDNWYVFSPATSQPKTGLVFYPGGRVDARSYAPAAHSIAAAGHLVVIVPMPLNLAVLSPNRAINVIEAYPEISKWYIGGHSLGGAMAANFVYNHPDILDGLILWAAYPAGNNSLHTLETLRVASIYGMLDGLATPEKIKASQQLLPPSTQWFPIDGGNHAQFGYYGPQSGDNPATIPPEEQQRLIIDATLNIMR